MDYKEKYEQALENLQSIKTANKDNKELVDFIEDKYPELIESEDERIRKALIRDIDVAMPIETAQRYISWLKKQGEQKQHLELKAGHWYFCHQAYCERADVLTVKEGERFKCEKYGIVKGLIIKEPEKYFIEISAPSDNVKPKFEVGDWIVQGKMLYQIIEICDSWYELIDFEDNHYSISFDNDYMYHLWTIQDAKDGDVIVFNGGFILIFKEMVDMYTPLHNKLSGFHFKSYVNLDFMLNVYEQGDFCDNTGNQCNPATKEQRDLLFSKMKEAGYEWDAEKKELKKIEHKLSTSATEFYAEVERF